MPCSDAARVSASERVGCGGRSHAVQVLGVLRGLSAACA